MRVAFFTAGFFGGSCCAQTYSAELSLGIVQRAPALMAGQWATTTLVISSLLNAVTFPSV
jgi:hypothetical protein